ncbi:hypothetical protein BDN70DRAFT_901514 [Pholiota conissans]|uniref:Uncharacterized protein n=1 Tax=Pholiota conissans TaxID=109636 RepID=A0A9P6CRK3_9AGAR|nr:hypothetical protein BDN70DRAFT_901514 [Pholiota conissans]
MKVLPESVPSPQTRDDPENIEPPRKPYVFKKGDGLPKPRKYVLEPDERAVIKPFREAYRKETDPARRVRMFEDQILVAIFNHWNVDFPKSEEDERIRKVSGYIHNNWRRRGPKKVKANGDFKVSRMNLVREVHSTQFVEILEEMCKALNVLPSDPGYIAIFNKASSAIYNSLTPEEDVFIDELKKKREAEGNPAEMQRLNYKVHGANKLRKTHKAMFLEYGVLQFSMVAHWGENGRWTIELVDEMAELMGVVKPDMFNTWQADIRTVQRHMITYLGSLRTAKFSLNGPPPNADLTVPTGFGMTLGRNADMMPVLPEKHETEDSLNVKHLSPLLAAFFAEHYKLASGNMRASPPYKHMGDKTSRYVDAKYLPGNFKLRRPHDMLKAEVVQLLDHFRKRQITTSEDTFRFKAFGPPTKLQLPRYSKPPPADTVEELLAGRRERVARAKKRKGHGGKSKKGAKKASKTVEPDSSGEDSVERDTRGSVDSDNDREVETEPLDADIKGDLPTITETQAKTKATHPKPRLRKRKETPAHYPTPIGTPAPDARNPIGTPRKIIETGSPRKGKRKVVPKSNADVIPNPIPMPGTFPIVPVSSAPPSTPNTPVGRTSNAMEPTTKKRRGRPPAPVQGNNITTIPNGRRTHKLPKGCVTLSDEEPPFNPDLPTSFAEGLPVNDTPIRKTTRGRQMATVQDNNIPPIPTGRPKRGLGKVPDLPTSGAEGPPKEDTPITKTKRGRPKAPVQDAPNGRHTRGLPKGWVALSDEEGTPPDLVAEPADALLLPETSVLKTKSGRLMINNITDGRSDVNVKGDPDVQSAILSPEDSPIRKTRMMGRLGSLTEIEIPSPAPRRKYASEDVVVLKPT